MPIVQIFVSEAGGDESALQTDRELRFRQCCLYGKGFFILGKGKKKKDRKVSFQGSLLFQDASAFLQFFLFGSDKSTSSRWK